MCSEVIKDFHKLLEIVSTLQEEIKQLKKDNTLLKNEIDSLKEKQTPQNTNYFERLKHSNDYGFICQMGKQGKSPEGWNRYYDVIKQDSDIVEKVDNSKCNDTRDGFIAEYLFEKNYVYGSKKCLLIGYLNMLLSKDKILQKDEQIINFDSLFVEPEESCIDLKLKLYLNNGTSFIFPLEIKSIVNGCENTICTASPMLSYYIVVRLINPEDYKAFDNFFIVSPSYILKECFELNITKFRETDPIVWKKTGRQLPPTIDTVVIKHSMLDGDVFFARSVDLPFFTMDVESEQVEPRIISDIKYEHIHVVKTFPEISEDGKQIREKFIEILKLYFKDNQNHMPYEKFIRGIKYNYQGHIPSYEGLCKLTKILKRFGINYNTKCASPYISCDLFEIKKN